MSNVLNADIRFIGLKTIHIIVLNVAQELVFIKDRMLYWMVLEDNAGNNY